MEKCPNCGFVPTLGNRRILKLFQEHFLYLPIMEMIDRGWIKFNVYSQWGERHEWHEDEIPQMLEEILKELLRFFEVSTTDELKAILGWEGDLMDKHVESELQLAA